MPLQAPETPSMASASPAPGFPFGALHPGMMPTSEPLAPNADAQAGMDLAVGKTHYLIRHDPGADQKSALTYRQAQIAARSAMATPAHPSEPEVATLAPIAPSVRNPPEMPAGAALGLTDAAYQNVINALTADIAANPNAQDTPLPESKGMVAQQGGIMSATSQGGIWGSVKDAVARFWAWLKGLWARLTGGAKQGMQGVGLAAAIAMPGGAWQIHELSSGRAIEISPPEARAAIDAAESVRPPLRRYDPAGQPLFALHNGAGIGMNLTRAQALAAARAITTYQHLQQAIAQQVENANANPFAAELASLVPHDGGHVLVDESAWARAFDLMDRGIVAGAKTGAAPVDAALSIYAVSNDPASVEEVSSSAAAGDVNACFIVKAMIDAQLAAHRRTFGVYQTPAHPMEQEACCAPCAAGLSCAC